jgi:hypothetical protein
MHGDDYDYGYGYDVILGRPHYYRAQDTYSGSQSQSTCQQSFSAPFPRLFKPWKNSPTPPLENLRITFQYTTVSWARSETGKLFHLPTAAFHYYATWFGCPRSRRDIINKRYPLRGRTCESWHFPNDPAALPWLVKRPAGHPMRAHVSGRSCFLPTPGSSRTLPTFIKPAS